ncbi:MAG: SH3 domain-containing protein [Bacillota bacterium]
MSAISTKKLPFFLALTVLVLLLLPLNGEAATTYKGVGVDSPTKVYAQASTNSNVLKSYSIGSILKYQSYSSDWYMCTVYLNGKATTGYIPKSAVESIDSSPETVNGIALKSPTNIYSKPIDGASTIKGYSQNTVLKYETFTSSWYKAKVYKSGKAVTGYIKASDVETGDRTPTTIKGIALNAPTKVYSQASTGSSALKSYPMNTVLIYDSFVSNWYKAKVYVNGKAKYGYIHASHVRNGDQNPTSYKGIALKSPTNVYLQAYTSSSVLKSYGEGRILSYKSFVPGWYQATVYVNGKARDGYINANDVVNGYNGTENFQVRAIVDKVHVRSYANTGAPVLKSYDRNTILKVQEFSNSWYQATVYVNGVPKTGYIYKSDTSKDLQPDSYLNLDLRKKANITANDIVNFFNANSPNNILKDQAQIFIDAQNKYGVNATYLVAHAIWETGWGKSTLTNYKNNLFGYGAYDVCPTTCAFYYPAISDSIDSAAYNVKRNYLNSDGAYFTSYGPNLTGMNVNYASDQNWKNGISKLMERIKPYDDNYYASASILPLNAGQPATFGRDIPKGKPYPTNIMIQFPQGIVGEITESVKFRSLPFTRSSSNIIQSLAAGTQVDVLGYNTDVSYNEDYPYDYRWYRVSVNGQEGWVYGGSFKVEDLLQVHNVTNTLNIRKTPETLSDNKAGTIGAHGVLKPVLKDGQPEMEDGWYHVYLPGSLEETGYVSVDYIKVIENKKFKKD